MTDKTDQLKIRLRSGDRVNAIVELPSLTNEELQELFPELIFLSSFIHGQIQDVRNAVLRLPNEWLLEHIEKTSEPILKNGDYEDYRRLLELYNLIDPKLTRKLAERATANSDPDIKEAGDDFLEKLNV